MTAKKNKYSIRELVEMGAREWSNEHLDSIDFKKVMGDLFDENRRAVSMAILGVREDPWNHGYVTIVEGGPLDKKVQGLAEAILPSLVKKLDLRMESLFTTAEVKHLRAVVRNKLLDVIDAELNSKIGDMMVQQVKDFVGPIAEDVYEQMKTAMPPHKPGDRYLG